MEHMRCYLRLDSTSNQYLLQIMDSQSKLKNSKWGFQNGGHKLLFVFRFDPKSV